ncbi:pentapeptide repeat-containing protein [Lentzea sp. NPDC058450]|uniref:pentapeptide repeat-containing protein n=1 Tax=Lentzea sp. NPDC058450 TaxID=3346505 RepID=UPI00366740CB
MTQPAAEKSKTTALGVRAEIALVAGTLLVTVAALVCVLWWPGISLDTESAKAKLDAVRTALSFGIGAGGAVALWLAIRRQRSTERDILNREQTYQLQVQVAEVTRLHQERVADTTEKHQERLASNSEKDASQRRVNEMYNSAVEQLGSDKAPVRLGALYTLERLADDDPGFRSIVFNVICAYLRMPLNGPIESMESYIRTFAKNRSEVNVELAVEVREEIEVRRTAQGLIREHLKPEEDFQGGGIGVKERWEVEEVRLSGATLINFDLSGCVLPAVDFDGVAFVGSCDFRGTRFRGVASFDDCVFRSYASFEHAKFDVSSWFERTDFKGSAYFSSAVFRGDSEWDDAKFARTAEFTGATNKRNFNMRSSSFGDDVDLAQLTRVDLTRASASISDDNDRFWPAGWREELSSNGERIVLLRDGSKSEGS